MPFVRSWPLKFLAVPYFFRFCHHIRFVFNDRSRTCNVCFNNELEPVFSAIIVSFENHIIIYQNTTLLKMTTFLMKSFEPCPNYCKISRLEWSSTRKKVTPWGVDQQQQKPNGPRHGHKTDVERADNFQQASVWDVSSLAVVASQSKSVSM